MDNLWITSEGLMGHEQRASSRQMERALNTERLPFAVYASGCPKCASKQHSAVLCQGTITNPACEHDGDHLHRFCGGCQHCWCERTMDDPSTPEIIRFRANAEAVLAIVLSELGGSVSFDKSMAEKVSGAVVATEVEGKIEVRLVPLSQEAGNITTGGRDGA